MTSGSRAARSRAAQGLAGRLAHNRLFQAALVVAVLATAAFQYWRPRKQRLYATTTIEVHATPIGHFARRDASRTRFGRLTFRGGLVLSSPSAAFGGWSALALDALARGELLGRALELTAGSKDVAAARRAHRDVLQLCRPGLAGRGGRRRGLGAQGRA